MKRKALYAALVLAMVLSLVYSVPAFAWPPTTVLTVSVVTTGQPGDPVVLTITETNDGDCSLTTPYIEVSYGGTTDVYDRDDLKSGDDGNGVLNKGVDGNPGESWVWEVTYYPLSTVTYTITGHAFYNGIDVTYPLDPDEQKVVTVYVVREPSVSLTKTVDVLSASPGEPVTYTYTVTNDGGVTLTNVTVIDDNGTPGYLPDDFVVGTVLSLPPGDHATFQVTKIPPVCLCVNVDGAVKESLLIIESVPDQNSDGIEDIRVTYRQSRDLVDNVYGVPATDPASGWPPRTHTFGNFTGSDRAVFRFTDSLGTVVLEFKVDYISSSSKFPSGFGTLGVAGGDGGMIVGSAVNVLSVNTTISANLNQSPAFYGFTTNSPTPESSYPTWDYIDGYTVVVNGALFSANGFGNVTVPSVHNSPAKIGTNEALPTPCESDVMNTARVTAMAGDVTLMDTASATVHVAGGAASIGRFTTFKQDQWGGDPNKPGGAKLLSQNFSTVYPTGVTVGGIYTLKFATASAVLAFLPRGGEPKALTSSAVNPVSSVAGELAGQVLALQLNVDFSNAGITRTGLAALHLKSGKLMGKTVAEVLSLANQVLGSNTALLPVGVSFKDLKDIVKKINEDYEKGTVDRGYLY